MTVQPLTMEMMQAAARILIEPEPERPKAPGGNGGGGRLDVQAYLAHYGIETTGSKEIAAGTIYVLRRCVFDSSHSRNEAGIIQQPDGRLLYQCFHDSCRGRTWAEARRLISGDESLGPFMRGVEGGKAPTNFVTRTTTSPEQPCPRFEFHSITDMLKEPKSTAWILKGIMDAGCLGDMFGETASMKSFLAIDMSLSIATGEAWHGYPVQLPGTVFYLCGEGFPSMAQRIKAWLQVKGLRADGIPFFVSSAPMQALEPASVKEVVQAIEALRTEHGKPVLIVIDTLNRNFGPGDENSTADMTRFVAAMDQIRNTYGCAVIVIHHTGLSTTDRARGASALRAALDWEYRLEKNGDRRVLTCTKSKDHEPPMPICFEPVVVKLDWTDPDDGTPLTSCVLRKVDVPAGGISARVSGAQRAALLALQEAALDGDGGQMLVHIEDWRALAYRRGISQSTGMDAKQKAFKRAVAGLMDGDLVGVDGDFYWDKTTCRTKPDKTGHVPTCPRTDTDTPL